MKFIFTLQLFLFPLFGLFSQCPTTNPTGTDGCHLGAGSVNLSASGSTGYYSWYTAPTGGTLLDTGSNYTTPHILSTTNYYVAAADTPSSLLFDGNNDYIAINNLTYSGTGHTALTVEAWIKTSTGSNQVIASYDRNQFWRLEINGAGAGTGQVGFDILTSSGQLDFGSTSRVDDGNWHHVAGVFDNGTVSIYIDGVLDASTTTGTTFGSSVTRYGFLGIGSEATSFDGSKGPTDEFNGEMNEVRIWNTARTAAQIANNKDICLTGSETGLTAYYNFNEASGTTLNDITGNGYTGTLSNFSLPSAWVVGNLLNCASCESSRTLVTATITGTGTDLGSDLCVTSSPQLLDAGAGFANYLWNTTATTQTINVSTSGSYWVTVDDGSGCVDSDTINVTFTSAPTGNDGCRFGPGTVDLSVSGSSGYYNWYSAATGGSLINTGSTYTTPYLTSTTTYYVAATDTFSALTFDGTNDYVALNMSYTNPGEINTLTVEAWVNTSYSGNSYNDNWAIVDFDRSEYYSVFVRGDNGQVGFSSTPNGGSIHDFYSGSSNTVNDGEWHHVAAVYDGTDKIIYIDGTEVARSTNPHGGNNIGTGTDRFGFIGDGSEANSFNGSRNNLYYDGSIDEVRIWNSVRSAAQISSNMDTCLAGNESGLVGYYNFNENSGTALNDLSGNNHNGTLFNFPASPWIDNAPINCSGCESPRTAVTATISGSNLNDIKLNCNSPSVTLDAGAGFSSYSWSTGASSQTINVTQQGIYTVTVTGGAPGCAGSDTVSVVGFTSSENSLTFDGTNDYIAIDGYSYNGSGYTELTVEAWIKTSSGGNQIIASFDRNQFWRFEINGAGAGTGQIGFDLLTSSGQLDFGGTTRIDDGEWHHVAGVFDNGTVNIYIDGILDASTTTGITFGSSVTRYGFIGRGSEATSFNGSTGPNDEFNGEMDDLKIWNRALSQTEIRNNMCQHVSGNEPGLDIYYKFDESSGTMINDYATSTISLGTMQNFGGSGHTVSSTPIGDTSVYVYTGSWNGQTLSLSSCDGDSVVIDSITSTPSGVHLYYINNDPTISAGITSYTSGNHYFGAHTVNGNSPQFDINYHYPNHSLFNSGHEDDLVLLTKSNNSSTPWNLSSSTVNTSSQEVNLNSQSSELFILDRYLIQWTGNTSTDWATGSNWSTGSIPSSGASILVPNVTNQPILDQNRTIGSLTVDTLADVDLNSFELTLEKSLTHNGSILSNGGTLDFNGTNNTQFIYANNTIDIDNIIIDNSNDVTISNGSINLYGTLYLSGGTFNTNNSITLISDASGTARIDEITGGAISGSITMQRYINAGATDWRFLTSAVNNTTLTDFNDDFITSGFTGSDFPNWPSAANPWPSIYFYDETTAGIQDNGFTAATNITNSVAVGEGLWIWCGDTITGTQPFTIDMTNPPNVGSISLPMSYTNSGAPADDGWNMVGNPYPSTLDWDEPSITKTNINNAIYIWNPDLQQFGSYVAGIGTNGGSNNIASSQAFWVQANAAGPVITVTEASKTSVDGAFLKPAVVQPFRLKATNNYGTDEIVINFDNGASNGFDALFDAEKMSSVNTSLPRVASVMNATEFSINQFPVQEISVPISITCDLAGLQQISVENVHALGNTSCLILEDLFTGAVYDLNSVQSFTAFISDTTSVARFLLHIGAPFDINVTDMSCYGNNDAEIVFAKNTSNVFDVVWKDANNVVIANATNVFADTLSNLTGGTYFIESTDALCGNSVDTVVIAQPSQITSYFTTVSDTINVGDVFTPTNQSVNAVAYEWNFGDGSATSGLFAASHSYNQTGSFWVSLKASQSANCFENYNKLITVIGMSTGIDELTDNDVKTWINNEILNISLNSNDFKQVEIRNPLGQIIYSNNILNDKISVDMSTYSKGAYIVNLIDNNNSLNTLKIIY